jgi:hypothetical protein
MATFDDLIVESSLVKAEMARLRELHGTLEKALELAIRDLMLDYDAGNVLTPTPPRVRAKMDDYLRRAVLRVGGAMPS